MAKNKSDNGFSFTTKTNKVSGLGTPGDKTPPSTDLKKFKTKTHGAVVPKK